MIGRIYRIDGGGKFYIGSTTQDLKTRLKNHKSKSKEISRQNTPLYVHFNLIGWEHAEITSVQELEITDRKQLGLKEDEVIREKIDDEKCLNKARVNITKEERKVRDSLYGKKRRENCKDEEKQRVKMWRMLNPEKRKEQTLRYRQRKTLTTLTD
jgi:predicted GIY-YIG superfamily endonuclease